MPSSQGWGENVLYSFGGFEYDGENPFGGVIFDGQGNLYGTTLEGGDNGGQFGTAFELTPANGGWVENVIYNFCSQTNCADGNGPGAVKFTEPTVVNGHVYAAGESIINNTYIGVSGLCHTPDTCYGAVTVWY
jgi:hypothetical protein